MAIRTGLASRVLSEAQQEHLTDEIDSVAKFRQMRRVQAVMAKEVTLSDEYCFECRDIERTLAKALEEEVSEK